MVDLSQPYSNTFRKIIKYKRELPPDEPTSVKSNISENTSKNKYGETEIRRIRQKQKILSEYEIQEVIQLYLNGVSANTIATSFGCHRRTISDVLKRNGIEVSHKASAKPELVKKIIELYAKYKTPKEIGAIVGLDCGTVRQVLKDNGIYIRKAWEYPRK